MSRPDPGHAGLAVLLVVAALAVVLMSVLADAGVTVRSRVQAQTAADAAALASLEGGRAAAATLAVANGAVLVAWSVQSEGETGGEVVTVVVQRGDSTATARASNAP